MVMEVTGPTMDAAPQALQGDKKRISAVTSPLRAAYQIRRKYLVMKRRRVGAERSEAPGLGGRLLPSKGQELLERAFKHRAKPAEHFTFEKVPVKAVKRRRSSRRRKVLYPSDTRRYLPEEKKSKAKNCLFLLSLIVFFQIYNAIENLDDNVLKYDLAGLEKTLKREVFGQTVAIDSLMGLLGDYLATHIHDKPLLLSLNGPSGVGKSLTGRLLVKHFRAVLGEESVLQYFVLHHCPVQENGTACLQGLAGGIAGVVKRAEEEEKIPLLVFDEVEYMQPALLDLLRGFLQPEQPNEFLNAVYVLVSSHAQGEITEFVLQNASRGLAPGTAELLLIVQSSLSRLHPIWDQAEVVPFTLLERSHIEGCFLEAMMREGHYPEPAQLSDLSRELSYYTAGSYQYSVHGCKYVGSRVSLLR